MKLLKKSIPLWLLLVMILATALGTAVALTVYVRVERISVWNVVIEGTNIKVDSVETFIKGLHRVDVKVTVKNVDAVPHTAVVYVQLVDDSGEVILEQNASTGSLAGGSTWSNTFVFKQKDLVTIFNSTVIVIKELG